MGQSNLNFQITLTPLIEFSNYSDPFDRPFDRPL